MQAFETFVSAHGVAGLAGAALALFLGGLAKGAVGFALPLIAFSTLGAFLPAQTAVALLVLPILLSNVWQTLRDGVRPALATSRRYRALLLTFLPVIALSAQLLAVLPDRAVFGAMGAAITLFAASQLFGWRLPDPSPAPLRAEIATGVIAGLFGGVSGIWGPPIMMYLIARGALKAEQMRMLGVSFLAGSLVLTGAHALSGVLDAATAPLSLAAIAPVALGMALGFALHDRMDQAQFRRATLWVLALSGLNLLRRGLLG